MPDLLNSPLQLKAFSLEDVRLTQNTEFEPGDININLSFQLEINKLERPENLFKIVMSVGIENGTEGKSSILGGITASAIYEVPNESQEYREMVRYNGTSQLFGFIRSELYSITLKFKYDPILLPSVNLIPIIEAVDENEEQED